MKETCVDNNDRFVISSDFSKLVLIQSVEKTRIFGFDLLNGHKFISLKNDQFIKIDPHCNLLRKLITDNDCKVNIAESVYTNVEEQAKYLGISERNLFRLKNNI